MQIDAVLDLTLHVCVWAKTYWNFFLLRSSIYTYIITLLGTENMYCTGRG